MNSQKAKIFASIIRLQRVVSWKLQCVEDTLRFMRIFFCQILLQQFLMASEALSEAQIFKNFSGGACGSQQVYGGYVCLWFTLLRQHKCVEKWEDGRGRSRDGRGGCTEWRLLVCSGCMHTQHTNVRMLYLQIHKLFNPEIGFQNGCIAGQVENAEVWKLKYEVTRKAAYQYLVP